MGKPPETRRDRWTVALGMVALVLAALYVAARGLGLTATASP